MLSVIAICSVVVNFTISDHLVSFDRLISAIEQVESGSWSKNGGKANWKPNTWKQFSAESYGMAQIPSKSREAMIHAFTDYERRYLAEGLNPTIWRLATAWNLGYDGAKKARRINNDYGSRCENLAKEK